MFCIYYFSTNVDLQKMSKNKFSALYKQNTIINKVVPFCCRHKHMATRMQNNVKGNIYMMYSTPDTCMG